MCVPSTTSYSQQDITRTMLPVNKLALAVVPSVKKTKKGVTFNDRVKVKRHLHRNDYTSTEIALAWYSQEEEQCIKAQNKVIAGNKKQETRGLEARTPEGAQRRLAIKYASWDAVMDEQEIQFEKGIYDPEMIAMVYRATTYKSQIAATMMGSLDEQATSESSRPSLGMRRASASHCGQQQQSSPQPRACRRMSCRAA